MVRDEVVGVLDCQSENPDHFDSETVDLLTLFSTQASMALQNARLYSLERRRASQLEAINTVARETTVVLDVKELLSKACEKIRQAFEVSHVSMLVKEDEDLVLQAHHGDLTLRIPEGGKVPAGAGLWGRALRESKTVIENDVKDRSRITWASIWNRLPGCAFRWFPSGRLWAFWCWTAPGRVRSASAIFSRWNRSPTSVPLRFRMRTTWNE